MRRAAWFVVLLLAAAAVRAAEPPKPLWIAVGRPGLIEAVEPLAAKRKADGFETIVSDKPVAKALAGVPGFRVLPAVLRKDPVTGKVRPFRLKRRAYLLLVGDDEAGKEGEAWHLPAKRRTLYRWRADQAEAYASDILWGDLDGDLLPEVPVGRIPARTREEADRAVRKILAYEKRTATAADLRLVVWAGSPRTQKEVDVVAATALINSIQKSIPGWVRPWLLASDARLPFCGWPPDHPALFARQLREGAILGAMIGHAGPERFSAMTHGGKPIGFGAAEAEAAFADGEPAAPLLVLACEAGGFARPTPCLAEALFALPGGPVAVIAASTESHPLTNYYTGISALQTVGRRMPRLGDLWLRAQRDAVRTRDFIVEAFLRDMEGSLEPELNVGRLKRDQMLMYALLGDPATRLRFPAPLEATVERAIDGWKWKATRPAGAETLALGLRAVTPRFPPVAGVPDEAAARALFEKANGAIDFAPLPAPADGAPWEGLLTKGGWLRLVATGPGGVWAASLKLE